MATWLLVGICVPVGLALALVALVGCADSGAHKPTAEGGPGTTSTTTLRLEGRHDQNAPRVEN